MTTITETHQMSEIRATPFEVRRTTPARAVTGPCQLCGAPTMALVLDLGAAPLLAEVDDGETDDDSGLHEVRLVRCGRCGALQLDDVLDSEQRQRIATAVAERPLAGRPELARRFCEDAIDRWNLRGDGHIVEIGSGTGSLLRFFRAWQLPVLGIEPDPRLTRYARLRRIPTWRATFDAAIAGRIARAGMHADLLIISTPTGAFDDLREIFAAAATVLRPGGVVTFELPDVLRIVGRTRFDDVCHAHRVLPTIGQLQRAVTAFGLELIDVERTEMADGRMRVWVRNPGPGAVAAEHPRLRTRLRAEAAAALDFPHTVSAFARRAQLIRDQITSLIDDARRNHCTVAVYGASPSAVALANAVGLARPDVAYAVDAETVGCGATLPGTDVPIINAEQASAWRADLVLALDDVAAAPPVWEGVPVYAVTDLVDVVHRLTS